MSEVNNNILKEPQALSLDSDKFRGIEITEDLRNKIFTPNWYNKPENVPAVVSLRSVPTLSYQNIFALIASPGLGKSAGCESICSAYINPFCDALGFSVDPNCRGIIYVDNERTDCDVW